MKACPVCQARAFDDAEVCYGCMHRFIDGSARGGTIEGEENWEPEDGLGRGSSSVLEGAEVSQSQTGRMSSSAPLTRQQMAEAAYRAAAKQEPKEMPVRQRPQNIVAQAKTKVYQNPPEVIQAKPAVASSSSGWVVRFELPGCVPEATSPPSHGMPEVTSRAQHAFSHKLQNDHSAYPLVIHIQPEGDRVSEGGYGGAHRCEVVRKDEVRFAVGSQSERMLV